MIEQFNVHVWLNGRVVIAGWIVILVPNVKHYFLHYSQDVHEVNAVRAHGLDVTFLFCDTASGGSGLLRNLFAIDSCWRLIILMVRMYSLRCCQCVVSRILGRVERLLFFVRSVLGGALVTRVRALRQLLLALVTHRDTEVCQQKRGWRLHLFDQLIVCIFLGLKETDIGRHIMRDDLLWLFPQCKFPGGTLVSSRRVSRVESTATFNFMVSLRLMSGKFHLLKSN